MMVDRPPAYLSKSSLAQELDMAESTVDEMVKRGVLPKPVKLSSGCVRWSWAAVEQALESLAGVRKDDGDPYIRG
jgi:predicted DNA-binding transcriptional regulator AlpA